MALLTPQGRNQYSTLNYATSTSVFLSFLIHCHITFAPKWCRLRSNLRWCYSRWSPVLSGSLTEAAPRTHSLWRSWRLCRGGWTYNSPHACRRYRTKWLDATLTRASLLRTGSAPCWCCSNSVTNIIQGWKHKMLWVLNTYISYATETGLILEQITAYFQQFPGSWKLKKQG